MIDIGQLHAHARRLTAGTDNFRLPCRPHGGLTGHTRIHHLSATAPAGLDPYSPRHTSAPVSL
jgi:hypothetical protein